MTTENKDTVTFDGQTRINLVVQFAAQAMQGLLASKPSPGNVAELAVIHAVDLVVELEDHFRKEYAAKAAELKARQAADVENSKASRPLILVPGGGIIQ